MVYCSLLKLVKVLSLSTALFHSNTNVYLTKNHHPVAIRHTLHYPQYNIHTQTLVIRDKRFYDCLLPRHRNDSITFTSPNIGIGLISTATNKPTLKPIPISKRDEAIKPTVKPVNQSVMKPSATRPPPLQEESDSSSDEESPRKK